MLTTTLGKDSFSSLERPKFKDAFKLTILVKPSSVKCYLDLITLKHSWNNKKSANLADFKGYTLKWSIITCNSSIESTLNWKESLPCLWILPTHKVDCIAFSNNISFLCKPILKIILILQLPGAC